MKQDLRTYFTHWNVISLTPFYVTLLKTVYRFALLDSVLFFFLLSWVFYGFSFDLTWVPLGARLFLW